MQRKTKFAALAIALAMVFGASSVSAVTVAELQAQIQALMAQLAALQGGSSASATTFTQNLTVGSTGSEVTALQQMLVSKGHLTMPAGVAYGYFGPLTKAAVAAWQAANGVSPAAGYWGPISRAAANAAAPSTPGTSTPGSTAGISTPGAEGTITARLASTPTGVKVYEGDTKKGVLGIELEAKLSDVRIERIKLKLDESSDSTSSDRDFYRKIASRLYIMDGSTVLASTDLDSNSVVEESTGNFYVTVTGLSLVVPKDAKKVITVAVDAMSNWDSIFNGDSWTVTVPVDGVRAVDGAGVNLYSPSTGNSFSRDFTSENELIANATLKLSLNTSSPAAGYVIAAAGADEDEKDGVTLLKLDLKAEKDDVTITDLTATITRGGSGAATTTTAYLMDGSTVIDTAVANTLGATGGTVTFDNIDYVVSKDSTKTLSIAVDIRDANSTVTTYSASVTNSQVTDENSAGDSVTTSGSASSETLTVLNSGPEFTLKSSSVAYTPAPAISAGTSTAQATFVVSIKAVGSDLYFGTQAASTTFEIAAYKGGVNTGFANSSSTSFTYPSSQVTTSGLDAGVSFKLTENATVDVTVTNIFPGRLDTGALLATDAYAFGIDGINWSTDQISVTTADFMASKTAWRTSTVVMP